MIRECSVLLAWRAILWGGLILLLGWLFFQNLVPTGELVLEYKKGSVVSRISDLHPEQRVIEFNEDGDNQRFYVDPVYFDAKVPREFDTVTVNLAWQNQSQPILELGARKLRRSWGFVMKPLQNKIIDDVLSSSAPSNPHPNPLSLGILGTGSGREREFKCERYDGVVFCQRAERYTNLSSLLAQPPQEKVLTYNYALSASINHDAMNVNTDINGYNYLVATYTPPELLGDDWYQRSVTYNWEDFALYINEISFLISAPELNKGHGQIVLGDISILLKRDPLDWEGFVEYVKNQFKRLKT